MARIHAQAFQDVMESSLGSVRRGREDVRQRELRRGNNG